MRPLLFALVILLAACNGAPSPPPDAAVDAPAEAPLCSLGATEPCGCASGPGYRRCLDGPAWSACFCEGPDAALDADAAEAGPDVGDEAGPDAPSIDAAADVAVDADAACETRCDGACVDTSFDPLNCGGCRVRCAATTPHTRAQCFAGRCELPCADGYADCNDRAADGCEVFVGGADRTNCGSCRHTCSGTTSCVMGVCRPF